MKKLLFLILVLALTLGTLASCDLLDKIPFLPGSGDNSGDNGGEGDEGNGDGGNETVETDIQEAVKELEDQYSDDNGASTANDFELIAQMKINGTVFTVNWTTDNDSVKLELVDGLWCVDVPEDIAENTTYTLTATITTEGGQNAEVEFTRVLVASFGMISNPEIGKAYKFALLHGNEKKVVYFDGNNYNNYAWYLSYSEDQLVAVDVYLEAVEGVEDAYRLYYNKDGEKTYIVAFPRDGDTTKGTLKLDTVTPEEYYTWDSDYNTLVYTSVTGESFYIGSSGTYKSISLSAYSYINGATSYVAHLYGPGGEKEELPEQVLPEVPENYTSADLIDALYKLESGQTLEGPYELTGVISSIKYAYDPAYNNVSVNIIVAGREDKPVLAYRLNGGEELKVGDTITIFAGLTNYNGTYETTSGGVIREVIPGDGTAPEQPEVPSDAKAILDALYALADGASLEGSFTLTGKITALDSYKNPTIVVEGFENQPVYCYRLSVTNAIGDVITVTATTMKNYGGTYEFMNCTLVENGADNPSNPGDDDETPAASIDMMGSTNIQSHTNEQMIYSANGIILTNNKNTSSTNCYNNTGSYAARFYGGATIKIEYTGMTKIVLTLDDYSPEAGKDYLKGFDGMIVEGATIVREHDIVTIYFAAATDVFQSAALGSQVRVEKIDIYTGEVETPDTPDTPVTPDAPTYTNPVAGQAYDLFMELPTGKVYFAGSMSGDYLATTTDAAASVKIYFEEVNGGYHIYFMNGDVKTYITAAAYLKSNGYAGCHFYLTTDTPTLAWTYNTQYGIIEIYDEIEGKSDTFFAGTYGTYNTVSLSGAYYKDQIASGTQYPARIALVDGGNTDTPVEPEIPHEHTYVDGKCECGAEDPNYVPETPVEPSDAEYVLVTELKTGDHVLIGAAAHGKLLSATKTGFYNIGVDYSANNFANVTDAEIFVVTVNNDGSYTFTSLTGDVIALAAEFSSLNVEGEHKSWTLEAKEGAEGVYYVKNVGRGSYLEWYASKNNWSTYSTSSLSDLFEISFYVKSEGGNTDTPVNPDPETPVEPEIPHEHTYVDGKCECGAEDPNYVPETPDEPSETTEIVFDFGANGEAGTHTDGQDIGTSKEYTSGNYTLVLTDALKAFDGGFDKAGNSILKFGTGSVAGTVTFVVPNEVTSVVIYAARYKAYADNNLIVVNGTEYALTANSDDGQYEAITIDTTTNKTVTVASTTAAAKPRCVVNSIVWIIGEGSSNTPVEPETPHEHVYVDGKCECGAEDPNYVPETPVEPDDNIFTIPEVLASAEGTQVVVKGTVSEIYQAWNDQYNNISFYITDAEGNRLLVFRTGTLVSIGDQVTVSGTATLYNEVIQIAQGGTTVIDVAHVCSQFTEATCLAKAICVVCSKEHGEVADHSYNNGVCSVCGHQQGAAEAETITASKTMAELISELGWTSSTTKQSFNLDDVVSVQVNGGSNTGKAYNGDHIRVYATDTPAGTLTISLADGYELVSVKVTTQTGTYAFLCVDGSDADISNITTAVSGSSVVLNSVKNGENGKQVRVMAIEVVYKAA